MHIFIKMPSGITITIEALPTDKIEAIQEKIQELTGIPPERQWLYLEEGESPPSSEYFEYTVQSGDSLWLIAQKFGTTVDAIKYINNLTGDMIFPGQILKIPDESEDIPPLPPIVRPTLRIGDRGEHVSILQAQLHFWLFMPGPIDGIFGPLTQRAVIDFQRSRGLVADGIVGPLTWAALFERTD